MENDLLMPINYHGDYARQNLRLSSIEIVNDESVESLSLSATDNFTFVDRDQNYSKSNISYVYDHNQYQDNNDSDDDNEEVSYAVPNTNGGLINNMSNKSYPKPIVGINLMNKNVPNNPFSLNDVGPSSIAPLPTSKVPHNILQVNYSPKSIHTQSFEEIKKHIGYCSYTNLSMYEGDKFVSQHLPDLYPYYSRYNISEREQFVVYAWLYVMGGVYIGNEIMIKKDFMSYFKNENTVYLVGDNIFPYLPSSKFIASSPRCKFWEILFDEMKTDRRFGFVNIKSYVSGSMLLHNTYRKCKEIISLLPSKLFITNNICDDGICEADAYITPIGYGSNNCSSIDINLWWIFIIIFIIVILAILLFIVY